MKRETNEVTQFSIRQALCRCARNSDITPYFKAYIYAQTESHEEDAELMMNFQSTTLKIRLFHRLLVPL
ncbi:Uncharacterised protein [Chlamydia abortus]|nr:Uncharacterised protein [Chlamydia abortus]